VGLLVCVYVENASGRISFGNNTSRTCDVWVVGWASVTSGVCASGGAGGGGVGGGGGGDWPLRCEMSETVCDSV